MVDWSQFHVSAFVLHVREGRVEEYRRRHAAIWPEMAAALREAGIVHYDIFLDAEGRRVFGHQLRLTPPNPAAPEEPVILRWRQYMADVLEMDGDKPRRTPIDHVFHLTA
ncbi:MAG TPA: L-rhamnose mutarotase [Devosiaceae bacterium]|jgi:L-rhamnose mutarotase